MAFFSARRIIITQRADVFRASLAATMDRKTARSIANFALRFSNELEKNQTNICSPLSAEIVLGMLALGCRGDSRDELMKALGIPDDKLDSSFRALTSRLQSIRGVKLSMANKIYINKDADLKPEFKSALETIFDSSMEQLDFKKKEAAAVIINEWVAERTNKLIEDVVTAESFDENTSTVLINAIHFKGNWEIPFSKTQTIDIPFYFNETTEIPLPHMTDRDSYYKYGKNAKLKARLLKMYYEGFQSSMVIVLPDEVEGLSSMLQQLAVGHDLLADIRALDSTKVVVCIPKFKVETTVDLKELLPKLGIKSIFDEDSAGLDILTSPKKLFVSEAIQKAFIDVNEAGTEAAAVTKTMFVDYCDSDDEHPQFIANHPFLYLVLAKGLPVFMGMFHGPQ